MLLQCCWRKSQSVFGAPNGHDGHNEGGERGAPGAMALEMEMEEDAKTPCWFCTLPMSTVSSVSHYPLW